MPLLAIYTILLIQRYGRQRHQTNQYEELYSNLTRSLKFNQVYGLWKNVEKKCCVDLISNQQKKKVLSNLHMAIIKVLSLRLET